MSEAKLDRPADGICRLGTEWVNWFLVADGDSVTVVDCGLAGYYDQLEAGLGLLNLERSAIEAVVLTHYHSDHVGFAERLRTELGVPVHAPATEAAGVRGEEKVPSPTGLSSHLWRPSILRFGFHMARNGGMKKNDVGEVAGFEPGQALDVPGRPEVIGSPGHTKGHCSLLLRDRGVLISGDALTTTNFVDHEPGPQVWPFNEDQEQARRALDNLAGIEADHLLPGHGEPHHGALAEAVERARGRG
jgi:glyoxylase-like metal-dependent hydrolase (beta-lactamase superfamily II)